MKISELMSLLTQENELGKVIHTHIHVENLINEYLSCVLCSPENIKPINLDYFGKVHLALALGFPNELKKPLLQLGKIRNSFAHKLNSNIDSNYMNNFYGSFSSEQREMMMKIAKETNQPWVVESLSWKDVPSSDKFAYLCISLYYFCNYAIDIQKTEQAYNKIGRIALKQFATESK
ncbi:hypothetical protein L4B78_00590 [Vibrio anguillarum]|uniref:hypothetical protein n=1 Tax=Vibrio anguillarum TaxID=55601 RepID=UPI0016B3359B|nr:hypothetical protein [Vibrio anguillarum]NOI07106.1 hypothetical protein [Vibrio anguillarum]